MEGAQEMLLNIRLYMWLNEKKGEMPNKNIYLSKNRIMKNLIQY